MGILDSFRRKSHEPAAEQTAPEAAEQMFYSAQSSVDTAQLIKEIIQRHDTLGMYPAVDPGELLYDLTVERVQDGEKFRDLPHDRKVTVKAGDFSLRGNIKHSTGMTSAEDVVHTTITAYSADLPQPGKDWSVNYSGAVEMASVVGNETMRSERSHWDVRGDAARSQAVQESEPLKQKLTDELHAQLESVRADLDRRVSLAHEAARPVIEATREARLQAEQKHSAELDQARAEVTEIVAERDSSMDL